MPVLANDAALCEMVGLEATGEISGAVSFSRASFPVSGTRSWIEVTCSIDAAEWKLERVDLVEAFS